MAYFSYLISAPEEEINKHLYNINRLEKLSLGILYFIYKIKPTNFTAITHYLIADTFNILKIDKLTFDFSF